MKVTYDPAKREAVLKIEGWISRTPCGCGKWKIGGTDVSPVEGKAALRTALKRGRPKAEVTKVSTTIRFDADLLAAFKATGKGWQTRLNDALREWLKKHSPS